MVSEPVNVDIFAVADEKNENIYLVYAKSRDDSKFVFEPIPMRAIRIGASEIVFEGIKKNDIDNRWGIDYSSYSIYFMMDAMGRYGSARFHAKEKKIVILYF